MRRRTRGQRGHVLAEAMVAGAVVAWALSGVLGAVLQSREQLARATNDQLAGDLAAQRAEELMARPLGAWQASAGTTVTERDVGGRTGWERTTTISELQGLPSGAGLVPCYQAQVQVTDAQGRVTPLSVLRWKAY